MEQAGRTSSEQADVNRRSARARRLGCAVSCGELKEIEPIRQDSDKRGDRADGELLRIRRVFDEGFNAPDQEPRTFHLSGTGWDPWPVVWKALIVQRFPVQSESSQDIEPCHGSLTRNTGELHESEQAREARVWMRDGSCFMGGACAGAP